MLTYILLRSKFGSHCFIIWKYDTHTSNSLGDIRQKHWNMKYRSNRPTFIFRSNVGSYWPIIPKYDVHTSNSLQDITQNHLTVKYRSQWPTCISRANVIILIHKAKKKKCCVSGSLPEKSRVGRSIFSFFFYFLSEYCQISITSCLSELMLGLGTAKIKVPRYVFTSYFIAVHTTIFLA